jgi:putative sterol carrier protein
MVATEQECEQALHGLAERMAKADGSSESRGFDRTLTCTLRDLDVVFAGRLTDGQLIDIRRASSPDAQIRLAMTSDDLLALVAGDLNMGTAWATGRVKVDAGVRDLLRLRSIF